MKEYELDGVLGQPPSCSRQGRPMPQPKVCEVEMVELDGSKTSLSKRMTSGDILVASPRPVCFYYSVHVRISCCGVLVTVSPFTLRSTCMLAVNKARTNTVRRPQNMSRKNLGLHVQYRRLATEEAGAFQVCDIDKDHLTLCRTVCASWLGYLANVLYEAVG